MLGASQDGWVVPLVAAQSPDVAFIILKPASALPTWENNLYEVDNTLRLAGFPESVVVRAHRAGALFNAMVRAHGSQSTWSELRDTLLGVPGFVGGTELDNVELAGDVDIHRFDTGGTTRPAAVREQGPESPSQVLSSPGHSCGAIGRGFAPPECRLRPPRPTSRSRWRRV